MVGARLAVGAHDGGDVGGGAVRDHVVDQAVGAAVLDVGLLEAVFEQGVGVVAQAEVDLGVAARLGPRLLDVLVEHVGDLGDHERVGADRGAGGAGVVDGAEVGDRAERAAGAHRQHLRAQGGEDAALDRDRLRGRVDSVEEAFERGQRAFVVAGRLRVADADPDADAAREVGLQLGVFADQVGRVVAPDVDDRGADRQVPGAFEQRADLGQARRAAEPEGGQPGRLGRRRRGARVLLADRPVGSPSSVLAEVHAWSLGRCLPRPDFPPPDAVSGSRRRGVLQSRNQRKEVVLILSHMLQGTLEVLGR